MNRRFEVAILVDALIDFDEAMSRDVVVSNECVFLADLIGLYPAAGKWDLALLLRTMYDPDELLDYGPDHLEVSVASAHELALAVTQRLMWLRDAA